MCALLRPASYFLGTTRLVPSRPWPPHRVADGEREKKGKMHCPFSSGMCVVGITFFEVGSWPFSVVRWFQSAQPPFPEVPKRGKKDPLLPVNRCPTNP